ncbi:MAG TPA: hypothetical protein PKO23_08200 [Candidatus Hydrogenedentes bacterium]|nr:hypothetical protein [Candidatus Hydrogenedentota bacterium]
MTDITLEQRTALVSAWLQKTEGVLRNATRLGKDDLPPGYILSSAVFLNRQQELAGEAAGFLEAEIKALRRSHADTAAIASYKHMLASDRLGKETSPPASVNELILELARKIAAAKEEVERCDRLLRLLHGVEAGPRPTLPLYQYAQAWERFQRPVDAESEAAPSESKPLVGQVSMQPRRIFQWFGGLERSDKAALSGAILLSIFILVSGYLYIHSWGRLHMDVETLENGMFRLVFSNSFGETVRLNAPHTITAAVLGALKEFGVSVEVEAHDGSVKPVDPLDAQWTYKDLPGHLYGPILIGPLSSEEVFLHISPEVLKEQATAIHITLYRSPRRKYAMKTISIP